MNLTRLTNVLGSERKVLFDSACAQNFTKATVLGDAKLGWRSASVCFDWALMPAARDAMCQVLEVLDEEIVDLQLTVSHAGDYFRPHYDNNWPETQQRRITFVYYLGDHATFTCGRLIFPDQGIAVEPLDDSLVIFDAGELHEIETVFHRQGRLRELTPARYTLNGWLR